MSRPKVLEQLSISEIEKLLRKRHTRLKTLEKKRGTLLRRVGNLDDEISRVQGSLGRGRGFADGLGGRGRRRLPHNEKSCRSYIVEVLAQSRKAMRPKEVADAVLAAGYKSGSDKFGVIVNQNLLNMKKEGMVIHDEANRSYKLARGKNATE